MHQHNDEDEYLVISGHGPLDGITITDGRGGFRSLPGAVIGGGITIARNAPAFGKSHGALPDFEWIGYSPDVPDVISGKPIRMSNACDALMVYDNGVLVQTITWPGDVIPREGQIHYLEGGTWDPRPLMIGQLRFQPETFLNANVTAFVSPDCSEEMISSVINRAESDILVNVYAFSRPVIGESLVNAKKRGVTISVLIEGGPMGGLSHEEKALVWTLNRSGVPVYAVAPAAGEHASYRFDHAKYIVIDRNHVLLPSENFGNGDFPPPGRTWNRGWGVVLEDPSLADYFIHVYLTDWQAPSIHAYPGSSGSPEPLPVQIFRSEFRPTAFFTGSTAVNPVIAPDTSPLIARMLESANQSIDIEPAYLFNESRYTLNPYLSSAINASRRG